MSDSISVMYHHVTILDTMMYYTVVKPGSILYKTTVVLY